MTLARLRWRGEMNAAERVVAATAPAWREAGAELREATTAVKAAEKKHAPAVRAADQEHDREEAKATRDLAVIAEASAMLAERPGLAKMGAAALLEEARRRLEEEERRHQLEARRQADAAPASPAFGFR